MSYSGSNAHELTARLLAALNSQYDVVDMHAINEIVSVLEKIHITKELLETTRLGKHVNLLRRRTKDPELARRAKVLVKRWRDLVIPGGVPRSGAHSNRTSAERQPRPLTSPALAQTVVSPTVSSPKSTSRPGWSGYDSDSNDVILVDDDPAEPVPLAALTPAPRPKSPSPTSDTKRAKKPKKKRTHSRAGSGAESSAAGGAAWGARNGAAAPPPHSPALPAALPPRRNGCKTQLDAYTTLIHRLPPAGAKKVKTTRELLEQIQSRTVSAAATSPALPTAVLLVDSPPPAESEQSCSPLRNGAESPAPAIAATPPRATPSPLAPCSPEPDYPECTCGDECAEECPARRSVAATPRAVFTLHHAHVPGVNGTRAQVAPHPHPARLAHSEGLFTSIFPLYRYLDYADDYCVKNLSRVELCPSVPAYEFAPSPPALPPPPSPPPPRPYPIDTVKPVPGPPDIQDEHQEQDESESEVNQGECEHIVDIGSIVEDELAIKSGVDTTLMNQSGIDPIDRVVGPSEATNETKYQSDLADLCQSVVQCKSEQKSESEHELIESDNLKLDSEKSDIATNSVKMDVDKDASELDGRTLYKFCQKACSVATLGYDNTFSAPVVPWSCDDETSEELFRRAETDTRRDELGRPVRSEHFAEWHEAARLTDDLVALPYVVID